MGSNDKNSGAQGLPQLDDMQQSPASPVKPRRARVWLDISMLVVLIVLSVAFWWVTPEQEQLAPLFDDLDMLVGVHEPEFYQELEFYYWLEQQHGQD